MITAKCDICGAPAPIEVVRLYENFLDMGEDAWFCDRCPSNPNPLEGME